MSIIQLYGVNVFSVGKESRINFDFHNIVRKDIYDTAF